MHSVDGVIHFSAADLVGHLSCRHLTKLDAAVARGELEAPKVFDPLLDVLWERGAAHEKAYVEHLEKEGFDVARVDGDGAEGMPADKTVQAMRDGRQIIVQGALAHGRSSGRTDILKRVNRASALGDWSYEVLDTKLARHTKGGTILQLSLYSDLVANVQGRLPERMSVVPPWSEFQPQVFRTNDYAAYYRLVRQSLEAQLDGAADGDIYPDPKPYCEICRWRLRCDAQRRADDHLSLVAGISKLQIAELGKHGITTVAALAAIPLPPSWKPDRGAAQTYERAREQARLQVEARTKGEPVYETLPPEPGFGLARLPEPSPGDLFLDLEADPYVGEAGLEFLFGDVVTGMDDKQEYSTTWAFSREDERRAFEAFIDRVIERWKQHPGMHVYHYAPYEPAALKRLMGRYATREEELDQMLRAELFVDLYAVVRHAIRAGVESYSIKQLEQFYGLKRAVELPEANRALARVQAFLELGDIEAIPTEERAIVQGYNRDDCLSALALRQWLEDIRSKLVAEGAAIKRPVAGEGDPSAAVSEWQVRIEPVITRLVAGMPADPAERTEEQQARWMLANLLDWHRREDKASWWEYFRLRDLSAEELMDERAALAGLTFIGVAGGTAKAPVHRYGFPLQDSELRGGESLHRVGGEKLGTLDAICPESRTADIKKRKDSADVHPPAVFAHDMVDTKVLAESLFSICEGVASHGLSGAGLAGTTSDLLLRRPPRFGGEPLRKEGESGFDAALRIATKLSGDVLAIQGPPGSGKTFTGARMIRDLIANGARIGVTANSHKVIRHFLDEILRAAAERGAAVKCIQKVSDEIDDGGEILVTRDNAEVFSALGSTCQVAGGTAWLWARPEARWSVDVLFIDEAAQMSLANVLAISPAGKNLVLLGDPQQLDQPIQGSHPEGTDVSALTYLLGGHQTIEMDRGLFLEETWRLHPLICDFTSEMFYEGRLQPRPGLENQTVVSAGPLSGSGLRFLPVNHTGNQNSSPEEADRIQALVQEMLGNNSAWIDRDGVERQLTLDDILIIAPYNAQVFVLQERLPGARIGTVDKFQGREAPIAIYSLTTSSPADAPHGMEFLYSLNRLNVATSRARCLSVVAGSPALLEPECRTPRQMQLANALCRFREVAAVVWGKPRAMNEIETAPVSAHAGDDPVAPLTEPAP